MSINASGSVRAPHPSPDELALWFAGTLPGGAGGEDMYQASRTSTSLPYGNIVPVPGVNSAGDEGHPYMMPDGLSVFGDSTPQGGTTHIALATRTSTAVDFGQLQPLTTVNSSARDGDSYVLPGGNVIYFTSNRTGQYRLYRSFRTGGAFSDAALVRGVDLDAADDKGSPIVTPDELTLLFYSNRVSPGRFDAYEARRSTTADDFGTPRPLDELNSSAILTSPNWISADGCVLYFARNVTNMPDQIYVAMREQ
jgi:Tol biopolymer transport system component